MQVFIDLIVGNKPGNTSRVFRECRKFRLKPTIAGQKVIGTGKLLALRIRVEIDDDIDLLEEHFSRLPFLKLVKIVKTVEGASGSVPEEELTNVEERGEEEIMQLDDDEDDDLDIDIFESYKGRRDRF